MKISALATLAGMAVVLVAAPSKAGVAFRQADALHDEQNEPQQVQSEARALAEDGLKQTASDGWNALFGDKKLRALAYRLEAADMISDNLDDILDDDDDDEFLAAGGRRRALASGGRRRALAFGGRRRR